MNIGLVEKIADAVLYEGYILYPYRPSAIKNQQRWNFGALCPEPYSLAHDGTEACSMRTECLARGGPATSLEIKVRFLHLLMREVYEPAAPLSDLKDIVDPEFRQVASLELDGRLFQTWQEAAEREVLIPALNLSDAVIQPRQTHFTFPSNREIESLRDEDRNLIAGVIVRTQQDIQGTVSASARQIRQDTYRVSVEISNMTPLEDAGRKGRDEALMRSLVSTHTILSLHDGEFISLLDPPQELGDAAADCRNTGTYPVLVGQEGERDCMLSSPIILYDYPQIATESAGELFDGTEIDEILTLRIMTLTDEEKRQMRESDQRARQILERTEMLPSEQLMKLHGVMRSMRPLDSKSDE